MLLQTLEITLVALTSFLSTSMDNLVLLAAILGQRDQRARPVLLGYCLCAATIAAAGLLIARAADALPTAWLGYLGVVPISMGVLRLGRLLVRRGGSDSDSLERQALGVSGVAVLMLANSSDTLAVFASLFAETPEPLTYVIAAIIVVASMAWFGLALKIGANPWVRSGIARLERWLVPLMLIGIGLYILADTATDVV